MNDTTNKNKREKNDALTAERVRTGDIGSRMGTFRKYLKLSVKELSGKTGIPVSTLKKYEGGHRNPGGDAILEFAITGVNLNWLIKGEGPMLLDQLSPGAEPEGPVDRGVLRDVVEVLEEVLQQSGRVLAPADKAELILLLCDEITEQEGKRPGKESVARLLRLVK